MAKGPPASSLKTVVLSSCSSSISRSSNILQRYKKKNTRKIASTKQHKVIFIYYKRYPEPVTKKDKLRYY